MVATVDLLRRNDPARVHITIDLGRRTSDRVLSQALERNRFVTFIRLAFGPHRQLSDYDSLTRAISKRENLKEVDFRCWGDPPVPTALVLPFWKAVLSNTSVEKISFAHFRFTLGSELFTTLCARLSSALELKIFECDIANPTQREQGASALLVNANIESLKISYCPGAFTSSLLRNLTQNTSVKSLELNGRTLDESLRTEARQLMETTETLQRFELTHFLTERISGEWFRPIAEGLINSNSVCELSMAMMFFNDDEGTRLFQGILQNKQNLTFLSLHTVSFRGEPAVLESICTALTHPSSSLRCLELNKTFAGDSFSPLLRAVANSKLKRFKFGTINSLQQLQSLTDIIPLLPIRELEIWFAAGLFHGHRHAEETVRQDILRSVKKNFCLRSVVGSTIFVGPLHRRPMFNRDEEQRRLAFFFSRNERLDQWIDNPTTLDQKLWPKALAVAAQAGRDKLYTSLRSVLTSNYVSLQGGKKRRRTQC